MERKSQEWAIDEEARLLYMNSDHPFKPWGPYKTSWEPGVGRAH